MSIPFNNNYIAGQTGLHGWLDRIKRAWSVLRGTDKPVRGIRLSVRDPDKAVCKMEWLYIEPSTVALLEFEASFWDKVNRQSEKDNSRRRK